MCGPNSNHSRIGIHRLILHASAPLDGGCLEHLSKISLTDSERIHLSKTSQYMFRNSKSSYIKKNIDMVFMFSNFDRNEPWVFHLPKSTYMSKMACTSLTCPKYSYFACMCARVAYSKLPVNIVLLFFAQQRIHPQEKPQIQWMVCRLTRECRVCIPFIQKQSMGSRSLRKRSHVSESCLSLLWCVSAIQTADPTAECFSLHFCFSQPRIHLQNKLETHWIFSKVTKRCRCWSPCSKSGNISEKRITGLYMSKHALCSCDITQQLKKLNARLDVPLWASILLNMAFISKKARETPYAFKVYKATTHVRSLAAKSTFMFKTAMLDDICARNSFDFIVMRPND